MRHNYYKIILLLIFIIIPLKGVKASSSISIDCPAGAIVKNNIVCTLNGSSDTYISSLSAKVTVSENMEFVSFQTNSVWQGNGNAGIIDLYTESNKTGTFPIGTVTLKVNSNETLSEGTIYVSNIRYYDNNFKEILVSNSSKNIKILSSNNDLASLSLSMGSLTPKFDKNVVQYSATVDASDVVVSATPMDKNATVSGVGRKYLSYGINKISVIVTGEDGSKKEYKIFITRPEAKKEETPKEDTTNKGGSGIISNNKNNNDNNNLDKNTDKNSNLKDLSIDGFNFNFKENLYEYNINVDSDVNSLQINTVPGSNGSNVSISGNENFVFGLNKVIITVTDKNGSKKDYVINVTKKEKVCVVKEFKVLGYDLDFDCNNYNYELVIKNEKSLNIDVVPNNKNAKVNIYNNSNLKNEDTIEIDIKVDGSTYKYRIKIFKNEIEVTNLFNKNQILFGSIVLISMSLYFILRMILKKINLLNH